MNFDTNGSISMFFAHCVATTTFLVQKKAAADHEYKTKISRDAFAQVLVDGGRKVIFSGNNKFLFSPNKEFVGDSKVMLVIKI